MVYSDDGDSGSADGIIQAWCRVVVVLTGTDLGEDQRWFAVLHVVARALLSPRYPTSNRSVCISSAGAADSHVLLRGGAGVERVDQRDAAVHA